ncbi:DUF1868 domain-containing protein [Paenibacillus thalictri]|uniref:DUF1868 domain-containing protein n=1 Tax=Paenibacillus thalictri TaxID=2527873 RepID=UPI0013EEEE9F|nr:DUF1868 domain-containing protein [Paenibacillus thalictri]
MDNHIYTAAVGRKFNEDGSVRRFPGNTIICTIGQDNPLYSELVSFAESFKELDCSRKYTLLPSSSYHMTVIQGVCEEVRKPEQWSRHLSLDAPLEETDRFFSQQFTKVRVPEQFRMKFSHVNTSGIALTVNLLPAELEVEAALRTFRDEVSEWLGLRFPNHDTYKFHISIAYKICQLTEEEESELQAFKEQAESILQKRFGVLTTSKPQLVFFSDMFKFDPAGRS